MTTRLAPLPASKLRRPAAGGRTRVGRARPWLRGLARPGEPPVRIDDRVRVDAHPRPVALQPRLPQRRGTLFELARYFVASALALGADAGTLAAGTWAGLDYVWAAALGFLCGLAVAYWVSVRWVFTARSMKRGAFEFGVFAAVGVAGLGLTEAGLWLAIERMHWSLPAAKIGTAGVVFLFNFGVRKALLFRGRP